MGWRGENGARSGKIMLSDWRSDTLEARCSSEDYFVRPHGSTTSTHSLIHSSTTIRHQRGPQQHLREKEWSHHPCPVSAWSLDGPLPSAKLPHCTTPATELTTPWPMEIHRQHPWHPSMNPGQPSRAHVRTPTRILSAGHPRRPSGVAGHPLD